MIVRSRFLFLGTGYYDYDQPLQTATPGIDDFQGKVIHPQFWPKDYDYTDKKMVIIGSVATTISIVPAVAEKVKNVTTLQRSPTYYFLLSQRGKIASLIFSLFPEVTAHKINRRR